MPTATTKTRKPTSKPRKPKNAATPSTGDRPLAIAAPATPAPPTHYRLSVEPATRTAPDGEVITTVELYAVDDATGERWCYTGPLTLGTHTVALDLIARVFSWERRTGETFSPLRNPAAWAREGAAQD